jgi:hypothetical protein
MQAFLLGEADIDTTKAGLQSAMTTGAEALCTQESFAWCP